jgi:hypothetical protein
MVEAMPTYKNPGILKFETKILDADGRGAYIEFPFDVTEEFGVRGLVPVKATFDGLPYRGSLCKMGTPGHILIVVKDVRKKIGKEAGDNVEVEVQLDEELRVIALAADAEAAVRQNAKAQMFWEQLSYSHKREYQLWLEGAKRPETRAKRLLELVKRLADEKRLN